MLVLRGRILLSSRFTALLACMLYCIWGKAERGFHVTLIDPQNFGGKFNPRHKSEPEGWVGKWRMWESRLGGELARVPASRVDVPVVIRIHLQGAMDFLYCKDVAPGPAVGK